ncbi:hypothetical protein CFC21_021202 [Triticum aestivum]|uniref:Wax synthase domain-containing protein n=2 Tax=Triticum aestivum TaxID=4565 RepID=A0A9R1E965_WHEAT|nr:acyl-CoA--sterol O-acyltransferase 1-like [Triticum aestivum]KAF7006138.1 hypothetical protein CFC21_021202 [Triticum aestivum]
MELLRDSIPMVSLAAAAAALYARMASSLLRPGLPRLVALLPLFPFLAAAPLALTSSAIVRATAAFFLAWLCAFKLALLAAGRGPLDPALPVLPFVFTALLPVKLRPAGAGAPKAKPLPSLLSCAAKVAAIAAILRLYQYNARLHPYARRALYGVHIYCFLDLFFPCIAAAAGALGMETEPQFDRPYLASSLRDFWGRRWNLMVSAILRPSVYDPVRARAGSPAGVLATFLVSGLMHEGMVYYLSLRRPDGRMTAFFLLHGVCCVVEGWCARRWAARGWPSPPRAVATVIVVVFVAGTSFWLFFPPLCKDGGEEKLLEEWAAVAAFFLDAGRKINGVVRSTDSLAVGK